MFCFFSDIQYSIEERVYGWSKPIFSVLMELKEPVIMDITETFRNEDIKADFFDFVVTPETNDSQTLQQFTKQMRNVNFLGNSEGSKEANNNNMIVSEIPTTASEAVGVHFDANFWEKESVRIESAILEDLNKYCWSTDETNGVEQLSPEKCNNNNTDGQIYTLTVLNGIDQGATWYRPPEKDESISSPNSMEHLQGGIDIDSFLNIIPGQLNSFNNNYNETLSPNTDGLIKSETYTYEDSGFVDKEEIQNALILETPMLEGHDNFNNNNNDWKMTNNNTISSIGGSADSLLRSALQGKAFVRYNGTVKNIKAENNTELRRALSTPPTKTETVYMKDDQQDTIPTIVAGIDANGKSPIYSK